MSRGGGIKNEMEAGKEGGVQRMRGEEGWREDRQIQ
jgi:hypothetical protein